MEQSDAKLQVAKVWGVGGGVGSWFGTSNGDKQTKQINYLP